MNGTIGTSRERKEAWDKVTGRAKYAGDIIIPGMLHARLVTSAIAHGRIISVKTEQAKTMPGVKAVITGKDCPILYGVVLDDRPALALDTVRYFGEPVAIVVAQSEKEAAIASQYVKVEYDPLPAVNSVRDAVLPNAPLVHPSLCSYKSLVNDVYPVKGTNISSQYFINKGNAEKGFLESAAVVEQEFFLPKSSHAAMETRTSIVEILPDGTVNITTSSQSPFFIRKLFSKLFSMDEGRIHVYVPFVGGSFGGKSAVMPEILAYIASHFADGRPVKLSFSREQEITTATSRLGLYAKIKLGADKDGLIKAADMLYLLDSGAYTDISPYMSKAIAANCTGPYRMENLHCESSSVYTDHGISNSFRGFSHESYTFCVERTLEALAKGLGLDPFEIRLKNSILPGDTSPTLVSITRSNAGNVQECLQKLRGLIRWDEGRLIDIGGGKVRAKGISSLWKTSTSPTKASAGAIITFNSDGSVNLNTGAVEMGSGGQSLLAEILADKLRMDYGRIHVKLPVDTELCPYYWKTVASMTTYMLGNAVMRAADDVIDQLKSNASIHLRCAAEDLDHNNEFVFIKQTPEKRMAFKDLVYGIKYNDGNAAGYQVLGRGSFIMNHLTPMERITGKGKTGPAWTVGAQAVEIELDRKECSYRLIKAATVMDVGKLIDPNAAECIIRGGMSMGLSLVSRENFIYDEEGIMQLTSLRNYKLLHIGQEPEYLVGFVETPQLDSPYGIRVYSEHGIIGMPAALANALSAASGTELNEFPLTPELIWKKLAAGVTP